MRLGLEGEEGRVKVRSLFVSLPCVASELTPTGHEGYVGVFGLVWLGFGFLRKGLPLEPGWLGTRDDPSASVLGLQAQPSPLH